MRKIKYPRISHTKNSHPTDDDLITREHLFPREWIVTEKVDGAQMSITFENGELIVTNRGTVLLKGDMDRQFHMLPQWIYPKFEALHRLLHDQYILFGEWLCHKHTVYYDALPDWFIAFGILDKQTDQFLPFDRMCVMIDSIALYHVPVLYRGLIKHENDLPSFITTSHFGSEQMEGVVLHAYDDQYRYKYVTDHFRDSIDQSPLHWRYKTRTQNKIVV